MIDDGYETHDCNFGRSRNFDSHDRTPGGRGKEAGVLLVRVRAVAFITDTSGTTDTLGGSARTSNDFIPELVFTYFFTKNIALDLILATTEHTVEVKGSTSGDLDLGTVRFIPPVPSLQYHFMPDQNISPYVGVGIQYLIVADHKKEFVETDIHVNNATIKADGTDRDPRVFGIGVGYKF